MKFCFYHKSHTEQPSLLSDTRTCIILLEAARLSNKQLSLGMSWDEGGQQHWAALSLLRWSLLGSRTSFSCFRDALQNKISWGAEGSLGRPAVLQKANNASGIWERAVGIESSSCLLPFPSQGWPLYCHNFCSSFEWIKHLLLRPRSGSH